MSEQSTVTIADMTNLGERENRDSDSSESKPPLFGSWRRVYWFVALFFFVQVAAFFVFTRIYS